MARASLQNVGGITVWMIIFVALWLTSTVFLVVLYTGQEELKSENDRLQADNGRLISQSERNSVELVKNLVTGGPTAVGVLETARRDTALLATGNPDDDVNTIRANRDRVFAEIESDGLLPEDESFGDLSLLEALTALYQAHKTQDAVLTETRERADRLEDDIADLTQLNETQKSDFEQRAKQLTDQLAAAETDRAAYRTERDQAVERMQRQFEEARAASTAELTTQRQRTTKLERDLAELRKRFVAREEKFGELLTGPEALATARQADGSVLTAIPGDDVVYINLGRKDRLTLGLQFAVYSPEGGIPLDGRSKAQIEVVAISEATAECKIVGTSNDQIVLEGDLIANPIYDPTRAQTFLVVGDFDLDGDGRMDQGGAAIIESMITDWGGALAAELTARTDFVVLGASPRKPRPARDLSPEQEERNRAMQRIWDRYQDTLASAKALSIPVLTQDLFLNFLGYHNQYASRSP